MLNQIINSVVSILITAICGVLVVIIKVVVHILKPKENYHKLSEYEIESNDMRLPH